MVIYTIVKNTCVDFEEHERGLMSFTTLEAAQAYLQNESKEIERDWKEKGCLEKYACDTTSDDWCYSIFKEYDYLQLHETVRIIMSNLIGA